MPIVRDFAAGPVYHKITFLVTDAIGENRFFRWGNSLSVIRVLLGKN
jgi:hypothetical protein